jgi:hypothetical protein
MVQLTVRRALWWSGVRDVFDKAIVALAMAYADQNERDHARPRTRGEEGDVQAVFEDTSE